MPVFSEYQLAIDRHTQELIEKQEAMGLTITPATWAYSRQQAEKMCAEVMNGEILKMGASIDYEDLMSGVMLLSLAAKPKPKVDRVLHPPDWKQLLEPEN